MLPVKAPAPVGEKATVNEMVCPANKVTGSRGPLTLKPSPLSVTCVTLMLAVPVFVMVTFCVALVPAATVPKLRVPGVALNK